MKGEIREDRLKLVERRAMVCKQGPLSASCGGGAFGASNDYPETKRTKWPATGNFT